jgi:hypothetical protein
MNDLCIKVTHRHYLLQICYAPKFGYNSLEVKLCSQPLLRCYLDYMCGCIPHIHTHPNFPHYALTKINIKYYIKRL